MGGQISQSSPDQLCQYIPIRIRQLVQIEARLARGVFAQSRQSVGCPPVTSLKKVFNCSASRGRGAATLA